MSKTPGNVSGKIFDYKELLNKLDREITRLTEAELNLNEVDATDHAINAAFAGFHLLEWEEKSKNPNSITSAWDLLLQKNHSDLNLLHAIVTKTKHVTVSNALHTDPTEVKTSAASVSQAHMTESGETTWERSRRLVTKFGDERAFKVLMNVLTLFKGAA